MVPGGCTAIELPLRRTLVLLNTSQQSQKVGKSERLSLSTNFFRTSVLLTYGLNVQVSDTTGDDSSNAVGTKKFRSVKIIFTRLQYQ